MTAQITAGAGTVVFAYALFMLGVAATALYCGKAPAPELSCKTAVVVDNEGCIKGECTFIADDGRRYRTPVPINEGHRVMVCSDGD